MPHFPKPFFRAARNAWYVQLGTKQLKLAADRDEAFRRYHELMAKSPAEPSVEPSSSHVGSAPPGRPELVAVVVDLFLDFVQKHRAADTYRWYKDRLQLFINSVPPTLTLAQLKPFHVQRWIDGCPPGLSSGTKRNYCRSAMRAMRWAEEQGYVDRSPLAHFKKPPAGRREQRVPEADFRKLLASTKDQQFKDLLTVTWETGCRPQESLRVEARHVDLTNSRWVFPASEAKGGRQPRVVYLTPAALDITKRLMEARLAGPLFRNADGRPWTPDAANCRFQRLKRKVGVGCSLYALRHEWINRKLEAGVDAFTVALLAGHSDPSMLAKHYQHLSQSPEFLLAQARRASA